MIVNVINITEEKISFIIIRFRRERPNCYQWNQRHDAAENDTEFICQFRRRCLSHAA